MCWQDKYLPDEVCPDFAVCQQNVSGHNEQTEGKYADAHYLAYQPRPAIGQMLNAGPAT
jgi:hypothetical protein